MIAEAAMDKCNSARTFGTSSADFVKRTLNDPGSVGREWGHVLAISGFADQGWRRCGWSGRRIGSPGSDD